MNEGVHISQAAEMLSVTAGYLRLLERQGLIPPARRDTFGNRIYSETDLALLRALGIGQRPRRLRSIEELLT
jgi:DNA-binding transcriptional MerR regulator